MEVAAVVARGLQAWDNESKAGKYRYISLAQVRAGDTRYMYHLLYSLPAAEYLFFRIW